MKLNSWEVFVIRRSLAVLALLLLPVAAAAQQNDIGFFISTSQFDDSELTDGLDTFEVDFEEDMGYGILYNRFWTRAFSTEFAYQRLGADLSVSLDEIAENAGELDLDMLTATGQLHFGRSSLFAPYVGGGVAYVSGEAGFIDEAELERADLESELDWLLNAGVNIGLGRFALFVDGKYVMYEARGEEEAEGEGLDVNPLILSGGVKIKF